MGIKKIFRVQGNVIKSKDTGSVYKFCKAGLVEAIQFLKINRLLQVQSCN